MKRTWRLAAFLGAFALLAVHTAANAQATVSRPLKMAAESQQTINLGNGAVSARARGVATHLGSFTADGSGNLADPVNFGTLSAANGDEVYYEGNTATGAYAITGGTGRFKGAGGVFVITVQMMGQPVIHPENGTMTIELRWTASGTIIY
ncbi:MAG TPA: hypothetical protein VLN08_10350 [Vicinamibacterales bacterium]|nr:hypothetical protein [Vicinamibacterales bacterium]